jgi:hypothetical protein
MKALSLTQPWATLIAIGAKRIETRSWYTHHRGLIAIHASKGFPKWAKDECKSIVFASRLFPGVECYELDPLVNELPLGSIVATAHIVACIPTNSQRTRIEPRRFNVARAGLPQRFVEIPAKGSDEVAFGDYSADRFMWFLEDVTALAVPIPCRGALSLWDVPSEVEQQIHEQIALAACA